MKPLPLRRSRLTKHKTCQKPCRAFSVRPKGRFNSTLPSKSAWESLLIGKRIGSQLSSVGSLRCWLRSESWEGKMDATNPSAVTEERKQFASDLQLMKHRAMNLGLYATGTRLDC